MKSIDVPVISIEAGCLPEAWEKAVLGEVPRDQWERYKITEREISR